MNSENVANRFSNWPHWAAKVLVCATFPLIWVGGLVTTYDAGMAVPDWPQTYGENMFLYSWRQWLTGPFDLFIEHGHRLMGATVGFVTIAFVVATFLCDSRAWMRIVSIVALLAVIGQGALGGMRVLFDDRQVAMVHGCVGPAFFALTAALAVFTSRWWRDIESNVATVEAARKTSVETIVGRKIQRLSLLTAALAYLQLVLGASMRHVPIDATVGYFRALVVFHLVMAFAVLAHTILLRRAVSKVNDAGFLRRATWLVLLVSGQIALGAGTWIVKWGWPDWFASWNFAASYTVQTNSWTQAWTTTAHVANGSLILALAVATAVRALRAFPFLVEDSRAVGRRMESDRSDRIQMQGAAR